MSTLGEIYIKRGDKRMAAQADLSMKLAEQNDAIVRPAIRKPRGGN